MCGQEFQLQTTWSGIDLLWQKEVKTCVQDS